MKSSSILKLIPKTLFAYYLTEQQFNQRFELIHEIEDPYGRVYQISRDMKTEKRVAVRSYAALEEDQQHDVIQNMQSFRKLGDVQGMCKLIAFAKKQESGIISAAFEYNDFSIEELLKSQQYDKVRYQLYLLILRQMVSVIDNAKMTGIIIEEIIPSCILLQTSNQEFRLKILYDEREKKYDKIQQGYVLGYGRTKVLASAQKIEMVLTEYKDYQSTNCQQAIFELGLLLLDLMFEFQMRSYRNEKSAVFAMDTPLQRNNLSYKSYLIFQGDGEVEINTPLIKQKVQFLNELDHSFITQFTHLISKMIAKVDHRVQIEQIYDQIQALESVVGESARQSQKKQLQSNIIIKEAENHSFLTPNKQGFQTHNQLIKQHIQISTNHLKNITSQTTVTSPNYTSTTDQLTKYSQQNIQPKRSEVIIPKEKLLLQAHNNPHIFPKFEQLIYKLQGRGGIVKKEYFDGSQYYGELNANNKRDGTGIYIYNNGDIYFGIWKYNQLVDGNYLFRNGESFEGVVKNGKQGYGRYCYANGNIYEGEWRDDVKNGVGKMKYPNGDIYNGNWSKGKKNGQGKYNYCNGPIYVGNFVDGKKNGFGVITFPNGTKIQAFWNQTHIEGPGKVFYNNGNYFQGNYHLSEKQGKGLYKWQDTQYQGEFKNDLMQGHACIRFSDKEFYNGKIKNGKRDGKGYYQYANGDEFNGDWRNDQKILGHYKFHQGGSFEGRFKNNELSYGVMVYQNGESYDGEFVKGERQGLGVYRGLKNEILFEGKWQRDQFISPL